MTFRREKYVPFGGPDGGDGGRGGDVIIRAQADIMTLHEFGRRRQHAGENGEPGRGKKQTGKHGSDVVLLVPVGTIIRWTGGHVAGEADLTDAAAEVIVARGGAGGRGNTKFTSSTNRAPRLSESGEAGEEVDVTMELKLLADAGLVGLPNAGKSSLLAMASGAHPKVGAYAFTTTEPNLGVVENGWTTFVLADIPGLIEGAHEGKGLGDQFLRHIERTAVLIHIVDGDERDPVEAWRGINRELALHQATLVTKPQLLVINKIDIPDVRERLPELLAAFEAEGAGSALPVSAVTGDGVEDLMTSVLQHVVREREERAARDAADATRPPPTVVLRPEPARVEPVVSLEEPGVWRLSHPRVERLADGVDFSDMGVATQFWSELGHVGAIDALEKAGAQPGDWVLVGTNEVMWR